MASEINITIKQKGQRCFILPQTASNIKDVLWIKLSVIRLNLLIHSVDSRRDQRVAIPGVSCIVLVSVVE